MAYELNPEQQRNTESRILFDATLIKGGAHMIYGGAKINSSGSLDPTPEQMRSLYEQYILSPQIQEFMTDTQEGQRINNHVETLHKLGVAVMKARVSSINTVPGPMQARPNMSYYEHYPDIEEFRDYCKGNDLDIDIDLLTSKPQREEVFWHAESVLDKYPRLWPPSKDVLRLSFRNLTFGFIEFPQFRTGNIVKAPSAESTDAELQELSNWKIIGITWDNVGLLQLENNTADGATYIRQSSAEQLIDWNIV